MNRDNNNNRHSSSSQGQETIEAFAALFRGRTDVYGYLYDETDPDKPRYSTEKGMVTLDHYRLHLAGRLKQSRDFTSQNTNLQAKSEAKNKTGVIPLTNG